MRPKTMRQYAAPLAAIAVASGLVSGCASASSSPAAAGASHQPGVPTGGPSAAHTSPPAAVTPTATATASTALLDYVSPASNSGRHVHKTVVGATYKRLAADLAALKPVPSGTAMCNVLTAESATITVTAAGHTKVFFVEGSPCRGVRLTVDGVTQPLLAGSVVLINQVRAIAGTSGLAHPLNPS